MTPRESVYRSYQELPFVTLDVGGHPPIGSYSSTHQDFDTTKLVVISVRTNTKYCVSRKFCENPGRKGRRRPADASGREGVFE